MKVLVYGSTTFGSVVRSLVEDCGHEFAGFIDDVNPSASDVIGPFDAVKVSHPSARFSCVNAVGYNDLAARQRVTDRIVQAGYTMPSLVHARASVGRDARIHAGCMVMAGAVVDYRVELGACTVVWPGVVIAHDTVIGANTFLSPNCTICGCCVIGDDCFVGAGAVIVDHATVPPRTRIKAAERYVTPRR
jgi:sugar O-acyltransferase (sialic acid O-acetyltransferase NeuD family)